MADVTFPTRLRDAARQIARLEMRRRALRKRLTELDAEYHQAQTQLKLLVQSFEPYAPPAPGESAARQAALDDGIAR